MDEINKDSIRKSHFLGVFLFEMEKVCTRWKVRNCLVKVYEVYILNFMLFPSSKPTFIQRNSLATEVAHVKFNA